MLSYTLVVIVAILNICSTTLFKNGVRQAGGITTADLINPFAIMIKIATTPLLLCGLAVSACTTVAWLATLTRLQATVAIPLMNGIFYLLLLVVSTVFLGEDLGLRRIVAMALILCGAMLLVKA